MRERIPVLPIVAILVAAALAGCTTSFEQQVQPALLLDTDADGVPDTQDGDDDGDGLADVDDPKPLEPAASAEQQAVVGPSFLRGPALQVPRVLA